jgi:hypothetical protein
MLGEEDGALFASPSDKKKRGLRCLHHFRLDVVGEAQREGDDG